MKELGLGRRHVNVTGYFIGVYLDKGGAAGPAYAESHKGGAAGPAYAEYHKGKPVFLELEGIIFLAIFSTPEKFHVAMSIANLSGLVKIQQITDHNEFIVSVAGHRLMLDPWIDSDGDTRFTELHLPRATSISVSVTSPEE